MKKVPDEELLYLVDETENENEQLLNNFERIFFLLFLFIITALGSTISVVLYVLMQCYSASKSLFKIFRGSQDYWHDDTDNLLSEQLRQSK